MKKITLFLFLLLSLGMSSQPLVLTQAANEPIVGDVENFYLMDTSLFTAGLPISSTGSNVVWNYTNLKAKAPLFFTTYADTSIDTNSADFPGCTLIQDGGFVRTFIKSTTTPTTQTEILGLVSSTMSVTFTNSAIAAKYPVSYNSTSTDNISGSYSAFSFNGPCSGNITTKADGSGTLQLPGGVSLSNVLRVKSTQNLNFYQGFIPFVTIKQTIYNYYHASKKFPVLSVNYQSFALALSSPTISGSVSGHSDFFIPVGIEENDLIGAELSLYPNPVNQSLTLDLSAALQPKDIRIYTQLGQLVYEKNYSRTIDLGHLPAGIYLAEVSTKEGLVRKKLVKD